MSTEQVTISVDMENSKPLVVSPQEVEDNESQERRRRKFYRHPTDKRLGGVCGGLGEYFDIDPVLIRLLWLLVTVATGGIALVVYGVLWLVLPVGTEAKGQMEEAPIVLSERNVRFAAWFLIGLGILWLLSNTGLLPRLWGGFWSMIGVLFWPIALIAAGVYLLRQRGGSRFPADVRERMPTGADVKEGLRSTRQRIPLKRPTDDRVLLGVCSGLARTFNVDPAIVRFLWALFSIGSLGTGVLIYVALALVLPEDEPGSAIEAVEGEVLDPIA